MTTASDDMGSSTGSAQELPPHPERPINRVVPDAVAQRFLRIDDRYYFPDRTLAFIDQSTRIKVRTHNLETIRSVVAIMQARGWQVVRVTGRHEFREKVWHEASLRGIVVQGYDPRDVEHEQLRRSIEKAGRVQQPTADSRVGSPTSQQGDADAPGVNQEGHRAPQNRAKPAITGVLLAHAAAPYRFDPNERMSYYVRVRTEAGERTMWGADLERAIAESRSHPGLGEFVVLRQFGSRPVTVRVPKRDTRGELVGEKKITAQRATWSVETPEYNESLTRKAAVLRPGGPPIESVLSQYPDLAGAVVGLRLAEQYAQRFTANAQDHVRLVDAIRERLADLVERGERINLSARRTRPAAEYRQPASTPNTQSATHVR